jgi:lipopolysaccharide transport system ATP-binding protein
LWTRWAQEARDFSMNHVAIRAEAVSKRYQIGERPRYKALRDTLTDALYAPFRMLRSSGTGKTSRGAETIWALKDISFEIRSGEVVGVIGRNGAGKSTLLKILSRITEPTEGFVELYGRVGSLLEVGTGFHPELTGRENIYLNGSIIGMKKREVDRKFDDILAFSEIEQFVDTPVKYFSSGMYMRLAFAVAAHLEPEILIVDEVLAVGDAAFQKKCLGKMSDVAREGRTVLFVSHNMPAVRSLCQRCLVIEKGRLVQSGSVEECIDQYLSRHRYDDERSSVRFDETSSRWLRMRSATLLSDGTPAATLFMGDSLDLSVDFSSEIPISHPRLGFVFRTPEGIPAISANNRYQRSMPYEAPVRNGTIRCSLGMLPLAAGRYTVDLYLGDDGGDTHIVEDALSFHVVERDIWGTAQVPPPAASCLWWPTEFALSSPDQSG